MNRKSLNITLLSSMIRIESFGGRDAYLLSGHATCSVLSRLRQNLRKTAEVAENGLVSRPKQGKRGNAVPLGRMGMGCPVCRPPPEKSEPLERL